MPAIFAIASQTAMSSVPTATERSPWPPGFSLVIIAAQILCGIEVVAGLVEQARRVGFEDAVAEAFADEAALAVAAVRVEAVADHRRPSRTTSVTTATRLAVIFEKSI